jgi:hypothetical protein
MPLPRPFPVSTVSVMEDDEMLRRCAANVVADAGFMAVEAANADEAVAIREPLGHSAAFHIRMPGSMDGHQDQFGVGKSRIVRARQTRKQPVLPEAACDEADNGRPSGYDPIRVN